MRKPKGRRPKLTASSGGTMGFDATVEPTHGRTLSGVTMYDNVTLKWGIASSTALADWHQQIVAGQIIRKSVSIVVVDEDGKDRARWEVGDA